MVGDGDHRHAAHGPKDRRLFVVRKRIENAVTGLDELDQLPLAEHVERFDAVHTELTVALSSIDKV